MLTGLLMNELIQFAFLIGFLGAFGGKLLDFTFDYGHIFSGVRFWLAKRAAKRLGELDLFDESVNDILIAKHDFNTRLDLFNDLYWSLHEDNIFKGWICVFCLCVRMCFLLSVIVVLFYSLVFGFTLIPSLVFVFISVVSGYFFTLIGNKIG